MKVLHVASEVYPLLKTGGLADVCAALPQALMERGLDVRLLLPGFPVILDGLDAKKKVASLGPAFGAAVVTLRKGCLPSGVPAYVIDAPWLYARAGNPYTGPDGKDWADNPLRFALLGWVAAHLAGGELDARWRPDLLHAHDWHAALAPAYCAAHPGMTVPNAFTIHNLAYQGLFPLEVQAQLGLPGEMFTSKGIEFHGKGSFMKAGLAFSQRITTVSPTYAREIMTPAFGCGLEGVLTERRASVRGILNGVDYDVWSPATDKAIAARYDRDKLTGKAKAKLALQRELGLDTQPSALLLVAVSRLIEQKGLDLVLRALPELIRRGAQLALLGSGDPALEQGFLRAAGEHPDSVAVRIGYDEALSHRLIAGGDAILVPSRFEPCGLTQLYGLRYGTLPIVHRVGGLADTVVDASPDNVSADRATGFGFTSATAGALMEAVQRALASFADTSMWQGLMRRAMAQDFSWSGAAAQYVTMYEEMLELPPQA